MNIDLAHEIRDLVERADPIGGITASELAEKLGNKEFGDEIWHLLSVDSIVMGVNRHFVLHPTQRISLRHQNLHKMGTIRPIGPRDTLFNAAGDPIAVVEHMIIGQEHDLHVKIKLLIEARDIHTHDGMSLNLPGEIL